MYTLKYYLYCVFKNTILFIIFILKAFNFFVKNVFFYNKKCFYNRFSFANLKS